MQPVHAAVAQSVERRLEASRVTGSIPVGRHHVGNWSNGRIFVSKTKDVGSIPTLLAIIKIYGSVGSENRLNTCMTQARILLAAYLTISNYYVIMV